MFVGPGRLDRQAALFFAWPGGCFAGAVETYPAAVVRSSPLLYRVDDPVPPATAFVVGTQQVAAMVVGTITPPLLLANSLKFSPAETAYFINIALLASAFGTWLQSRRRGWLGAGLLSVTGTSFAFMSALTQAWHAGGLGLMLGMSCCVAPVQILLAPLLSRCRGIFPPLVCGIIVMLIGASLIPTAFFNLATPIRADAPAGVNLLVGVLVIGVIVATQALGRSWLRIAGMALGLFAGWVAVALAGGGRWPEETSGAWVAIPRFLPHGFAFSWSLVPPFAFIYLVSSLEAMGDMTATSQLSGLPTDTPTHWQRMARGVMADGVTSTVAALFGGFPSTTYAQNNGVIQITGVASRRVGYVIAGILAVMGLVPAIGRWIGIVPAPVLGALALLLFGLVTVSGLRLIAAAGLGQREAIIVALALGIGLGLPTQPLLLRALPDLLRPLLESGISAGGLAALLLNLAWPAAAQVQVTPPRLTTASVAEMAE